MEYVRPLSHSSALSRRENWSDLSFKKTPLMDTLKERIVDQEARPLSWLWLETTTSSDGQVMAYQEKSGLQF